MFQMERYGKLKPKGSADIASSRLGIGFEKLDRDAFNPEMFYDRMATIGVKWVRIQSGWQKTEKEKGVYDFAWLDAIVDNLLARKLKPWMCVCYGNGLYDEVASHEFGAMGRPPIFTEEQRNAWDKYCEALAKHYIGKVDHFEIWNEPDGVWCWKHGTNATELGNFTIATCKALKRGNPDCYTIGGATCKPSLLFMAEALDTGMIEYLDAFSFHEYSFGEDNLAQKIKVLRGLANMYGKESIEIVQGESGSQSRYGGYGAVKIGNWTQERQAKQLLRHMVVDLLCDVKFTSYFTCIDMIETLKGNVDDPASYYEYGYFGVFGADFDFNGLSTGAYSEKKSYYALQSLCSLLEGDIKPMDIGVRIIAGKQAPFTGNTLDIPYKDMVCGGFRLNNGAYAYAYWYPGNYMTVSGDFEGTMSVECMMRGVEPLLVDVMDGSVYKIPEFYGKQDEHGCCVYEHLPVRDYPLFLVFGDIDIDISK